MLGATGRDFLRRHWCQDEGRGEGPAREELSRRWGNAWCAQAGKEATAAGRVGGAECSPQAPALPHQLQRHFLCPVSLQGYTGSK